MSLLHPGTVGHFHGGLKLERHKRESCDRPIGTCPLADELTLPLQQHIGEPAEPLVRVGDQVRKGQMIARASDYVSAPVHAPTSGTVTRIEALMVPHPSGLSAPCIVIEPDGEDRWIDELPVVNDYRSLDPSALRNRIREAGIVGLGGAGFPSYIKLNPGRAGQIDTLILNAAECEPWITCDDRLIRERAGRIVAGAEIMIHALQARQCVIGIEDEMHEAIAALRQAVEGTGIEVIPVPTRYPAGGEKQLIQVLTGLEVPVNGLPLDIGITCHNVGTAAAIADAVHEGRPLISRIVTVTGQVGEPRNLDTLIGTPVRTLIEHCGGYAGTPGRLIMGGPMMGFTLRNDTVPVIKTTNCLLVMDPPARHETPMPCIRCGECATVCPARLLPQQLYWYAHAKNFDRIQDYDLFECIECGCCAHVCPSHIPLVQYYRYAKTEIWNMEREKERADLARERHEFRLERLEREKREREERMRKKKEALSKSNKGKDDPKKAAIEAALKRVREKQARAAQGSDKENDA